MSSSLSYRCNKMKGQPISLLQVFLIILLSRFDTIKGKYSGETTKSQNRPSLALPDGYFINPGDNVAYKIDTDGISWYETRDRCLRDGGHIVIIDTIDKLKSIRNITRETKYHMRFHIGIYRPTWSTDWIRVDNQSPVPNAPGISRYSEANGEHECTVLTTHLDRLLRRDCRFRAGSICELPIDVDKFTDHVELQTNQRDTAKVGITWEDVPMNQFLFYDGDDSIICKVKGYPSPTVDWLFNGEVITTNDHYIIEPHGLNIKNVQESDDGIYTCRASVIATGQLDERAIRVKVRMSPRIEESDSTVEIIEGENGNIMCKGFGNPPPKFTWIKSLTQQDLATADRFSVDHDTGTLTITNANRNDAGQYQCQVTNVAGGASTLKIVKVIVGPKIIKFFNATAVVEKRVEMRCTASGRPPPQVLFRKHTADKYFTVGVQRNDDRITLKNTKDDLTGETTAVLTIENVSRSDDGLYECFAQNKDAEVFENGHLTVQFPPSFASMKNLTYTSWNKRAVNFTCIAESIPNATIRWDLNGEEIWGRNRWIKIITTGSVSTLSVIPADRRYYGDYECIASNIHGTREYTFELKKASRPETVRQASIQEITATTVTFDLVEPIEQPGFPLRAISVQYKPTVEAWSAALNKTWAIDSSYTVEGLQPETVYDFRFNGENEVGVGDWGATIRQLMPRRSLPESDEPLTTETSSVTNLSEKLTGFSRFGVSYEIHNEYLTHAESHARCVKEGGRLAIVDSFEKNDMIAGILLTGSVHVGIRTNTVNCVNEWVSDYGDTLSGTIPWAPNKPHPTRCAALRYDGSGLEEILCSDRLQFVCEIPIHR